MTTWKQFKEEVERQGMTDNMKIYRIDLDSKQMIDNDIEVIFGLGEIGVAII